MKSERWQKLQSIFLEALAQSPENVEEYIRERCDEDSELAEELLRMVRSGKPSSHFLEAPAPGSTPGEGLPAGMPPRLGDFELLTEIGRGAMGIVFRAWQISLGRSVAVKVLPPSFTLSQRQVERFEREAKAIARLHHPGIVSVITVGEERGVRYFAMDLVEGHDLADEVKRLREALSETPSQTPQLPDSKARNYFESVARLIRDVADALHSAHEHGVIHRDIKPSNLLLDQAGDIHVVDFGLARDEEQGTITKSGERAGTPHYMSPEQAWEQRHEIDRRTDIYSLGVVMFELLTLRRPFEGRSTEEVLKKVRDAIAPRIRRLNPRVPRDLATVCNTAMAKEADSRYSTAAELRADLDRILSHQAIHARPESPWQMGLRIARAYRRPLLTGVLVLLALVVSYVWSERRLRLRSIASEVQAIQDLRTGPSLEDLEPAAILQLQAHFRSLRELDGRLPVEAAEEVARLESDLDRLRLFLLERGKRHRDIARAPDVPEAEREKNRLIALQTILHAALFFPGDEELQAFARLESALPRLEVRATDELGREIPAEVYVHTIDVSTTTVSGRLHLGPAPVEEAHLYPGYYRIVVLFEDRGFRELPCNPGPDRMDQRLVAVRRANEERIAEGMIRFEGGGFELPERGLDPSLAGKRIELPPFLMDRTEVSNLEYAAFLEATGHRPSSLWSLFDEREAFLLQYGDRPVVGVTWHDATTYASWAGKRLPTAAEWLFAACGPEGRELPYVPEGPDEPHRANVLEADFDRSTREGDWQAYLEHTAPVDSHPEARTPEGLYHMYGNVEELLESMALMHTRAGHDIPRTRDRYFFGGAWNAAVQGREMCMPGYVGIGPENENTFIGFRCAKSASSD